MNSGASEAAFSSDGKTLWAISREGDALLRFQTDDGAKAPQPIKLPEAIDQDGGPMQLQTDPKGLLIAGAAKLWLWNPAEPKVAPKALATFPPQFEVSGMVRTPGKGNEGAILISGYHSFSDEHPKPKDFDETESLYRLAAGKKSFVPVFVRRLERVTAAPAFSGERMVFGGSYDVWEGGVEVEEPSEMPPTLWGQRIAPLAMCNTDGANSGSMGVHQVTIAGDTVWATMRGHLMGSVVSFPLPSHTDNWLVFNAGRSHYEHLLKSGVKIYERRGPLLHAKTVLIDGVWSTVGSANLDRRSFLHNQEINAVVLGPEFGAQMQAMFDADIAASNAITAEAWSRRPLSDHVKEMSARVWAYWL